MANVPRNSLYNFETAEERFNIQWAVHMHVLDSYSLFSSENLSLVLSNPLYSDLSLVDSRSVLENSLYPADDRPPQHVINSRKRRRLLLKVGEKSFYKWSTVLRQGMDKCHGICTICGEEFGSDDQVVQGAKGQFYHRSEMLHWIRQSQNAYVKDPNTNLVLETVSPPVKKRKTSPAHVVLHK